MKPEARATAGWDKTGRRAANQVFPIRGAQGLAALRWKAGSWHNSSARCMAFSLSVCAT
jgi:hypothetical protein